MNGGISEAFSSTVLDIKHLLRHKSLFFRASIFGAKCSPSLCDEGVLTVSALRLSAGAVVRSLLLADGVEEEAHWRVE